MTVSFTTFLTLVLMGVEGQSADSPTTSPALSRKSSQTAKDMEEAANDDTVKVG